MPTYQYRCSKCGHEFEEFQSMTDEPITVCPKCHGRTRRLITGGSGLLFKGSGFYITDYRSSQYKADQKKESSASSGSTTDKAPKSTDTKPAVKKAPSDT